MSNLYLVMWLESPLQAWGFDSKFGRRDTLNFPTKSGILGLLCCALGASGEQCEFLGRMASLSNPIISFVRSREANNFKNRVKYEREPLLRDFQMIGSGYNDQNSWENLLIPKTTKGGKPKNVNGAKLTYRYYLQNAFFAVILQHPEDISEILSNALQNPIWDLYLGRKNCVPSDLIYRGVFKTETEAFAQAIKIGQEKSLIEDFRVIDGEHEGDEVLILNDVPLQFGEHKKYRDRRVTVIST